MREKELRLALICYGGISLAVYMHGITKEIWHLVRASHAHISHKDGLTGSAKVYHEMLMLIEQTCGLRLRVLPDIIAGASAGGINGIFLAQAISSGQSLEPLTQLWLKTADVDELLAPEARAGSSFYHALALPIARHLVGEQNAELDRLMSSAAREEVKRKLGRFVRSRWFAPPFGGPEFSGLLLDALEAMAQSPAGPRLLPQGQPLDLFVTVTDFYGHKQKLHLDSPAEIQETEHRLVIDFHDKGCENGGAGLGALPSLAFAARATASFPGAFPPFTVRELDEVVARRTLGWPERESFLKRVLPQDGTPPEDVVLIDGSVLANAPFQPAINALKDRPARREIDRRFVYIDPTPGGAAIGAGLGPRERAPGFFTTITAAMSGIPREQPIHDSLEAIEQRSEQISQISQIVEMLRDDVEAMIEKLFGRTLFLNRPTPERLTQWGAKAKEQAARNAGYTYAAYAHSKQAVILGNVAQLIARLDGLESSAPLRQALEPHIRLKCSSAAMRQAFFGSYDLQYRIRQLRFVARHLSGLGELEGVAPLRAEVFVLLAPYLDRETVGFYAGVNSADPAHALEEIAARLDLQALDARTCEALAHALRTCPKEVRHAALFAWLGFPFFDIATLPLLQGEGLDEFNPIKVDRIAPDDATAIRSGGARAMLRGIEFHNFGAFFSRAYRENDYLWGRLHGVDRLIDIIASTLLPLTELPEVEVKRLKGAAFRMILAEEGSRLTHIPELFSSLEQELANLYP